MASAKGEIIIDRSMVTKSATRPDAAPLRIRPYQPRNVHRCGVECDDKSETAVDAYAMG
jgi:hypothetical protein